MNNLQLQALANRCAVLKDIFVGVYPSDCIPDFRGLKKRRAYALIVNLEKSNHPGTHWIALYLPSRYSGTAEYFDSYGRKPSLPSFCKLLNKYRNCIYNNVMLQSPFSSVCGQYCLFYLCHRARKESVSTIFRIFRNQSKHVNDVIVNRYVKKYFRTNLKLYDIQFIGQQIAVSLRSLM